VKVDEYGVYIQGTGVTVEAWAKVLEMLENPEAYN
jgi:hypothetical protein